MELFTILQAHLIAKKANVMNTDSLGGIKGFQQMIKNNHNMMLIKNKTVMITFNQLFHCEQAQ